MRIRKTGASLLSLVLLCCVVLSCFAFPASAAKVAHSQDSYTVSAQNMNSCLFVSNRISVGTEVGTEYFMTYTVKTMNVSNTIEELLDIARVYSCEIEYSDENIDAILMQLN